MINLNSKRSLLCGFRVLPFAGIGDCYHSLGHAVMYMSEYDVERAMVNCDSLHQRLGAYYCASGRYLFFRWYEIRFVIF